MRARGVLAGVCFLAFVSTVSPSAALSSGAPPEVFVIAEPTADPFTFDVAASASDDDGRITNLTVCFEEGPEPDCHSMSQDRGRIVKRTQDCLNGSSATFALTKTFSSYGIFRVTASATGSGCPVLAGEATVQDWTTVVIAPPPSPIPCAGWTGAGGATDVGVTAESVDIASTYVGRAARLGSTFGEARIGILAAVARINATGGVCDRQLRSTLIDDGGDRPRGQTYIQNLIADGAFALTAMPSPDGLEAAIAAGDVEGVPVVGTSGSSAAEFSSDWVWPVGPSNTMIARAAVREAFNRGARRFALAYVPELRFGMELAGAARSEVSALGGDLVFDHGAHGGQPGYAAEINQLRSACEDECDSLLLFMDGLTSSAWVHELDRQGVSIPLSLPPHNLTESFGSTCPEAACVDGLAWTGFMPPSLGGDWAASYVADIRAIDLTTDTGNPFVQSAYLGTMLLAEAMGRAGTNLTRERLRSILDTQSFDSAFTAQPLSWSGGRNANRSVRAMTVVRAGGVFAGWRAAGDWMNIP